MQGKDIRTRSSALIDDILLIDMAPEFSYQIMRDAIDATKITDLLFTHTHADHFNVGELFSRMEGFGHHIEHPLTITGNDRPSMAVSTCCRITAGSDFVYLPAAPHYRRTPRLPHHSAARQPRALEFCYVYFIEKEGKNILRP
ncbi:hypothetical protein M8494_34695 [Serratia ureilytica]